MTYDTILPLSEMSYHARETTDWSNTDHFKNIMLDFFPISWFAEFHEKNPDKEEEIKIKMKDSKTFDSV